MYLVAGGGSVMHGVVIEVRIKGRIMCRDEGGDLLFFFSVVPRYIFLTYSIFSGHN